MLHPYQKYTGTSYTTTVTLLAVAFLFSPAMLAVSSPAGYPFLSLAVGSSLLCVALAWVNWKKSSRLSLLSIAVQGAKAE